jgi:hypothetical protein
LGIINKIKEVMAFNAKHVTEENTNNLVSTQNIQHTDANQLNVREIAFLLEILKKSQFVGEQVEIVYGSILKLQNQYLKQTNQ